MSVTDEKSWMWKETCEKGHVYDTRDSQGCPICNMPKKKKKESV